MKAAVDSDSSHPKIDSFLYPKEWFFPSQEEEPSSSDDETEHYLAKKMRKPILFAQPSVADYEGLGYQEENFIKKGQHCDVNALLFTSKTRKYGLIHCQSGLEVDAEYLDDKFVLIVGFFIPVMKDDDVAVLCRNLIETYAEFRKRNIHDFEVVMAVKLRKELNYDSKVAQHAANHFFSAFPWLAVPFSENQYSESSSSSCTGNLFETLDARNYYDPACVLLSKDCVVLHWGSLEFLSYFGTDAYPFTQQFFSDYVKRCFEDMDTQQLTLENLLSLSGDDELSRISGEKVSVAHLNSTATVGVYLCSEGNAIKELNRVYRKCNAQGLKFEVVVVHQLFSEWRDWRSRLMRIDHVLKSNNITDWVVLPFSEREHRRLWRICGTHWLDRMIVVGRNNSCFDSNALQVLCDFGESGFPFARNVVLDNTVRRLSEVSVKSLVGERKLYRWSQDQDSVRVEESVSILEGRNLIVCVDYIWKDGFDKTQVLKGMVKFYNDIRRDHPDFEVVFVCSGLEDGASFDEQSKKMPWLFVEYDPGFPEFVRGMMRIFPDDYSWATTLIAFGKNGVLRSLFAQQYLPDEYEIVFSDPSILRREVFERLQSRYHEYWGMCGS